MSHQFSDYLIMWAASFALVFLLGIQSRNVQRSHYLAAVVTSFGISVGNFTFVKYASAGTLDAFWVCAAGGCMGIAFSIWFSDKVLHKCHAKDGVIAQKRAPFNFPDPVEGSAFVTPKKRLAIECAGRRAMKKVKSSRSMPPLPKLKCYECIGDDGCDGNCETKHLERTTQ